MSNTPQLRLAAARALNELENATVLKKHAENTRQGDVAAQQNNVLQQMDALIGAPDYISRTGLWATSAHGLGGPHQQARGV